MYLELNNCSIQHEQGLRTDLNNSEIRLKKLCMFLTFSVPTALSLGCVSRSDCDDASTDLLPSTSPECRFSSDVLGEWLLAEVDGLQKLTVTSGTVTASRLGEFICKGKHWNVHYYKLMSYYSNGWYALYPVYTMKLARRALDEPARRASFIA